MSLWYTVAVKFSTDVRASEKRIQIKEELTKSSSYVPSLMNLYYLEFWVGGDGEDSEIIFFLICY